MRYSLLFIVLLFMLNACDKPAGEQSENIELRIATFNVAMGLQTEHELGLALSHSQDIRLRQVAEILQRLRPDIVLLNEFDYDPEFEAADLFNANYLAISQNSMRAIEYSYSFRAPVNTGLDSALDLDGDGNLHEPEDAWGYGTFPGQYGMLVLSKFPIRVEKSRSFQHFLWADMPAARRPRNPDGSLYYPEDIWSQLRLSSKSHWDLVIDIEGRDLHLLASHPTPPVFDGAENRNGLRNYDEMGFWVEYLRAGGNEFIVDDQGKRGGLQHDASFVIAGDLNADPFDGDSSAGAVIQLLESPMIDSNCLPKSSGALQASALQAGINLRHMGNPAADTADFNDDFAGNLRLDYLLPSRGLVIRGCGVFWPTAGESPGEDSNRLADVSDHHLVWLDISL